MANKTVKQAKQLKFTYKDKEYTLEFTRRTVAEMEKKGFIAVRPSETDRRRKRIRRTDKARELDREALRVDEKTFERFTADLDEAQKAALGSMLDRLVDRACGGEKEGRET